MSLRLYWFALTVVRFIVAIIYPTKIVGLEHFPGEGPVVLCANHISLLDPVTLACAIRTRPVHFMAKAELFQNKFLGKFLEKVGAFPVRRGDADMGALRTSMNILKQNEVLGIFAQGHRDKSGEMQMESGVALIALRTQAPVIPVYMLGPYRVFRRFRIIVGPKVDLSKYSGKYDSTMLRAATLDIERAVRALNPENQANASA